MPKKILITGATGLVGSHLIEILLKEDQLDIYVAGRSFRKDWEQTGIRQVLIDFEQDWDESQLPNDVFAVIHLSQSEKFRDFPGKAKDVFYTNTLSTLKLANYAAQTGVKHFIYASSGGIYGNGATAFNENAEIIYKPEMGFYIGTKHNSEVILESYSALMNLITLRFFFVYGKGQRKDMLIPRLVQNVQNGQPITLQGVEGMKMNPIHAYDAAKAIKAAMSLNGSHTINVAGPDVLSIRQIGEAIGDMVGKAPLFVENSTNESKHLIGDISQMKKLLITPSIHFAEGIRSLL